MMNSSVADAVIVGFGPAGAMLASLLGQRGHQVVVLDKFAEPYGLPRMSTLDGEVARLLQHAADPKQALAESLPERRVELWGADGELKGHFDWDYIRAGHMSHLSLHQPNIEAAMANRIAEYPNIDVRWGRTATEIRPDGDRCTVVSSNQDGSQEEARARYVIGMDGAGSFVRTALGIDVDVLFTHDDQWILTDYDVVEPLPDDLERRIYFDLEFDQPYFWAPNGVGRVRTDVRVLPGTDTDAELAAERGLEFMEQRVGVPRSCVRQSRRKLYKFRSQVATSMRRRNVFIGGDAAHAMTPYMGQGACTAMRDAANLAWKLDLVLSGRADESLLDSYESERLGHSRFFVEGSLAAYRMINPRSQEEARERDALLAATGGDVTPPIPSLRDGIQYRLPTGAYGNQAGEVAPQAVVRIDGCEALIDDLVGYGFQLISTLALDEALGAERIARLDALGVIRLQVGENAQAVDIDGTYREYFDRHSATTLLSRPDVYVFGLAEGVEESVALVDSLLTQIPEHASIQAVSR